MVPLLPVLLFYLSFFRGEKGAKRNAQQQVAYLSELVNKYPIDSIEDGMDENDWAGWQMLTSRAATGVANVSIGGWLGVPD